MWREDLTEQLVGGLAALLGLPLGKGATILIIGGLFALLTSLMAAVLAPSAGPEARARRSRRRRAERPRRRDGRKRGAKATRAKRGAPLPEWQSGPSEGPLWRVEGDLRLARTAEAAGPPRPVRVVEPVRPHEAERLAEVADGRAPWRVVVSATPARPDEDLHPSDAHGSTFVFEALPGGRR